MSVVPTNIAQSLAGAPQAEQVKARERKPEPSKGEVRRRDDEVIVQPETLEAIQAKKEREKDQPPKREHPHPPVPAKQVPGSALKHLDMEA